jgi:dTDP-4-amino-4,6-dideoxygalactose transaminase
MARLLLSKAIDSMKYLDGIVDVAKKHFDYSGDCQIAEELSQKVLVIPNYFSLQKTDIARIAGYINEGWNNTLK